MEDLPIDDWDQNDKLGTRGAARPHGAGERFQLAGNEPSFKLRSARPNDGAARIPGVPARHRHPSQRALAARPSEVRQVFRAAQGPGMISFANGAPYLGALPFDRIAADAQRILLDSGERSFQYGSSEGIPELRAHISEPMKLEGITAGRGHP